MSEKSQKQTSRTGLKGTYIHNSATQKVTCRKCGNEHRIDINAKIKPEYYICYKCLPMQERECEHCGNTYEGKYNTEYCSDSCRIERNKNAGNAIEHKVCPCGYKVYEIPASFNAYCTEECAKKFLN